MGEKGRKDEMKQKNRYSITQVVWFPHRYDDFVVPNGNAKPDLETVEKCRTYPSFRVIRVLDKATWLYSIT